MNKNLRNRFILEFKNQLFIKLLLTAVLIYSSNQKVAGLNSGLMTPILSDVITDEALTNLLSSKEFADYKSVKLETNKMTPSALLDVSVSIVSNATNNSICRGTAVTFTATPTNGGSSPTYQWKINGVNTGTGSTLTSNNVLNNDVITVVMTTSLSSASVNNTTATSNAITLIVYNPLVLSTNQATISSCTGAGSATINAVSSNGSVIDWYANTASTTTPYLTSSNSYTTPSISTSKIYYAVARDTVKGCLSAKQSTNNISLSFDGVDDKVTSNITTFTSTSELTYETWVYANNFGGFNSFRAIANHIGFTTGMVHFQFNGNKLRFDVSGFNNTGCTYTFSPNTWYHVAAVYSASQKTLKYYVNGILETTFVNNSLVNIVGNSPFTIGSWDNSRFLSGRLDEFRIWNVARTQSEIQANMCEEIDQQAGLVASYHFNDGVVGGNNNSITTVIDASGNSNNGTLVNFAKTGSSSNYATGNGSINRTPIAVTLNPLPTVMSSTSGTVLCGGSSTTISATASDGAIIDWYAASTGGNALATGVGSFTTPAISATTTYYAEARDTIANCVSASRTAVTATVNNATTAVITNNTGSTELTCTRTAISVTATGGSTYLWSNSLGSSANASITAAGTYTVTVTGTNGCTSTASITVTTNATATAGITNNTASSVLTCATTAISVTATGGSAYLWSNSLGTSANASIISAGTYNVTVTGANGCTATSSITVTRDVTSPTAGITNNTGSTLLTCATNAISLTATGGATYEWSNSLGSSANVNIISAGTYIVTVTGANGCTSTSSITATQNISTPTAGITHNSATTVLTCAMPTISVTGTGGTSYSWSNSLGSLASASISSPGTYTVTVTAANGCSSTASVTISQNIATSTGDTTVNACNSFTWYGTTYTSSATPMHTYTNVNGCDSIVTLHLTINTPPAQPTLACYETANFNTTSCSWVVTGSQPSMPTLACYETASFNSSTCGWDITGSQPAMPTLACYETANFNTTSCSWIVTGSQPSMPTLACYETANFNTTSCSWIVTGSQPSMPTLACYETATFNTMSCAWDITGSQPSMPTLACYETATFNSTTCAWDVTGTQPSQPTLVCYETATFNTTTCVWDVTGSQPSMPTLACYETASFNTSTCVWDVTGSQPVQPTLACYETATFNTSTCVWVVTGSKPTMPTLACYETATFNTTNCAWDVTGTQPAIPTLACYETANFNTTTCSWDVTGSQPSQPTLACYESATFNSSTCVWDVTGTQPVQPSLACYESATFNTTTCVWNVTGTQPAQTTLACYETASFNTTTCVWDVTGSQPSMPTLACYETASFNSSTCGWDITGSQPSMPTLACYETASFNSTTCVWDVTGTQPSQPTLACYETATFNTTSCVWDVTGTIPTTPTLACYETASFNTTTCAWVVTGSQPSQPSLACYQTASFNTTSCVWDVTGTLPAQPTLACYETATFNTTTCAWVVTGTQPSMPTLTCYETATFNTTSCVWDVTGTIPTTPTLACYETASFNTSTCVWDVTGTQPSMPTLACYETASFNTSTCIWDVTGTIPTTPTLACYETASFNTTTCAWVVIGSQPSQPSLACYQTATFNTTSCSWVVTGSQPTMPTLACYQTANFNTTSCSWVVTGSQPVMPTLTCYETAIFNTTSCAWDIIYNGTNSSTTQTACASYTWNGSTYSQSGTYTYAYLNASGCASVDTLKLTINPLPASPVAVSGSRCGTGTVTLTATSATGTVVDWYASSSTTTPLLSASNIYTTPSISTSTNYFVVARDTVTGCLSSQPSQVNNALYFDGTNDFISVFTNTGIPIGSSNYTIEAWIKPHVFTSSTNTNGIIGWGDWITNYKVNAFRLDGAGLVNYWMGRDLVTSSKSIFTAQQWRHVACSYDGTTRKIYVDGVVVASDNPAAGNIPYSSNLKIGNTCNVEYFNGALDEIRVWNLGRTQSEIYANMNSTLTGNESGLVSYYNFDQGVSGGNNTNINTLLDLTSNHNNGTLNNFSLTGNTSNFVSGPSSVVYGSRTLVTATVNPLPASAVGVDGSRYGTGTVSLSATVATGNTVDWYAAATGGTALSTGSTAFTTPSIGSTTIYYAESRNTTTGCVSAGRTAVTATVNAILTVSVSISSNTTNNSICRGTAVTFTAIPTNGGNTPTYQWKKNGINAGNGSTLTIDNILNNDVMTVVMTTSLSSASVTSTTATSNSLTITVNNLPSVISTTPASLTSCTVPGSATINAVPSPGSVIDWYASTSSTTPLLTSSNSYTTPTISATTTYYAVARDTATGCQSNGTTTFSNALNFGSGIAYVQTTKPVTGSFTIEFWMNANYSSGAGNSNWRSGEGIVDASTSASNNDFGVTMYNDYVKFGLGNPDISITTTSKMNGTGWKHVAATWDSTSGAMKLYVNGLLEASAIGGTASRNGQTAMRLGTSLSAPANWAYGNYSGTLDEVRIWSKVKTQADIQANMNNNLNGREAGLVEYYNFNQGTWFGNNSGVTTLYDLTPNKYNGTLTNFSLLNGGNQMNYVAGIGLNAAQYPVTVTKSTIPTVTSTTGSTICGSGTTTLTATASAGAKIDWYANATGGTALATGTNTFTTPTVSATTVYYAEARDSVAGCVSLSRTAVTASIGVVPTAGITNNTGSTALTCTTTAISVTATGGSTYLWSNSLGSSANASITTAGTYTVTVTGANGCTATSSITVTSNATAPTAGITNNTGTTVLTCATTAISVTATGGSSYLWSNSLGTSANASITTAGTYTVTVTGTNGCTATSSITVTTNATATAGITNNTGSTILNCTTTTIDITATGGTSYLWSNSLGSSASVSITSPGIYTVTVTGANGCTSSSSITVTQETTAFAASIINTPLTTELNCNTQSINLNATTTINENFDNGQWNTANFTLGAPNIGSGSVVNGAYTDPTTSRSPLRTVNQFHPDANHVLTVSATIKFGPAYNMGFIATRSNGTIFNAGDELFGAKMRIHNFSNGVTGFPDGYQALLADSFYFNPVRITLTDNGTSITYRLINLVTLVEHTYTANTTTSNGDYVTFSGGQVTSWDDIQISYGNPYVSYNWVNGNGTSLGTSASTNVNAPGTYTVTATAANGCTSTASVAITQNIATSTGDTTVNACNSFTWYGTTYTSSATPTHTFNNINGCDSVVTLHLTINTSPALPTLACYETASLNSTTCSWVVTGTQPAMPTLACYETATFNATTCSWDVTGSLPATIVTTITNCGDYTWSTNNQVYTQSGTYNSYVNCQDYTLNLTVLPTTTYYADTDGDGFGNPSSTILACNGAPIGYVAQSGDCNDTSATAYPGSTEICGNGIDDDCDGQIDEGGSLVTNPIIGNLQICGLYAGATTLTTAPISGISTYNWTVPSDITITSGQGTNTITVYWGNIYLLDNGITGNVTVTAMGTTTGCGTLVPAKLPVDLNYTTPVTPPSISGPSAICPTESGVYSIATVKRATSYEWSVPAGATLNSGNGTNIIDVSYANGFNGGSITVGGRNVCGLSTPLRSRTVTLNILPAPSAITGPVTGLCNASNANYLVTSVVGATGYTWTVPANSTIISGSNSNSISVNYNSTFATGNITVAAVNNCGIGATRSLAVKAAPTMPGSITGPVNTCAGSNQTYSIATVQGASNYTWTVPNGATINTGQGSKVINMNHSTVPSPNGIITVKSTNNCGTSALKVLSVITSACPRLGDASIQLQVYPNPANEYINVLFNVEQSQYATIILRDAAGRIVYNETIDAIAGFNNQQIELSNLAKGVYFVQLQTGDSSENTRLIVE